VSTVLQPHTTYCCVCNPLRPSQLHQILLPKAEMLLGCISSCVTQKMPRQSPEFPKPLLQNWHMVLYRLWACQVAFWNTIGPIEMKVPASNQCKHTHNIWSTRIRIGILVCLALIPTLNNMHMHKMNIKTHTIVTISFYNIRLPHEIRWSCQHDAAYHPNDTMRSATLLTQNVDGRINIE
jgi:hypothetical protein